MNRKACLVALVASSSLITGCATDAQLNVRPVGAQAVMPVGDLIAQGRVDFALNNVALALERFRRAVRLQPDNVDALNGIAACYDRMGRFDLSRNYYERALALAPENPKTLHNFHLSLTMQGRTGEALALAREAAQPRPQVPATPPGDAFVAASGPEGVTVGLPPLPEKPTPRVAERTASARPAPVDPPPTVPRLERMSLGEVDLITASPVRQASNARKKPPERVIEVRQAELVKQTPTSSEWVFVETPAKPAARVAGAPHAAIDRPVPTPPVGTPVAKVSASLPATTPTAAPVASQPTDQPPQVQLAGVATPPPAPVPVAKPQGANAPPKLPTAAVSNAPPPSKMQPPAPKPVAPTPAKLPTVAVSNAPSPSKTPPAAKPVAPTPAPSVKLAAAAKPVSRVSAKPAVAPAAVRNPQRKVSSSPAARIRVLNAVGRKGLAGRYGRYLQSRGWAELRTADAVRRRNVTLIVYPSGSRAQAAALAKRLPFRTAIAPARGGGSDLMLILGNDALAFDNRLRQRVARA